MLIAIKLKKMDGEGGGGFVKFENEVAAEKLEYRMSNLYLYTFETKK